MYSGGLRQTFAGKPFRTVLRWQFLVTFGIALAAGSWIGGHAAISAILGGTVMMVAGSVYAVMTGGNKVGSAGDTLRTLLRAEASKIGLIVLQLWVVLTAYEAVVPAVFIGAFIVAVLIYPIALLVRD
jgi:F0F1-type ATP synthase assembly protein I